MIGKGGSEAWVLPAVTLDACGPGRGAHKETGGVETSVSRVLDAQRPHEFLLCRLGRAQGKAKKKKTKTVFTFGKPLPPPIEESL